MSNESRLDDLESRVEAVEQELLSSPEVIDEGARIEIDYAVSDIKLLQRRLKNLVNLLVDNGVLEEDEV